MQLGDKPERAGGRTHNAKVCKLQLTSSDRFSRKIIKMRNIEDCERRSTLNKTMRSTTKFHPPRAKGRAEEQSYETPGLIKYMTRNNVVDIRVLIRKGINFDSKMIHASSTLEGLICNTLRLQQHSFFESSAGRLKPQMLLMSEHMSFRFLHSSNQTRLFLETLANRNCIDLNCEGT